jgi:hypothetical protein
MGDFAREHNRFVDRVRDGSVPTGERRRQKPAIH